MGRPRKSASDARTKGVTVWLTPAEHAALSARAASEGVALSALLAQGATRRSARTDEVIDAPLARTLFPLVDEVRRVGHNVNQFTREFNTHGRYTAHEVAEYAAAFERLADAVLALRMPGRG